MPNHITNAYEAAKEGSSISPDAYFGLDSFTPYVITLDRNSPDVNFKALKSRGVIGVVLEAGYMYDIVHNTVTYQNPKLSKQYKAVKEAGLPVGLFALTRAKSSVEAQHELTELSLIVETYPPSIGMWLKLGLTPNTSVNNTILNTYQKKFVDLGLKDQIGLYVTHSQLSMITWSSFKNDWWLWIDSHTSSLVDIHQLLTPEFFDI